MPNVTVNTPFGPMTGTGTANDDGSVNVDISAEVDKLVKEHNDTQAALAAINAKLSTIQNALIQLLTR